MKDISSDLEKIGFTSNEAKVFLVLYKGKNMTAAEIAKEAGMQRTSVYEILKSFAEQGICNEIKTTTKFRYEMIDPDIVRDKISKTLKEEQEKRIKYLNKSFERLKPIYASELQGNIKEQVELIKGFNKHRHLKFLDLLKKAKQEVLLMIRQEVYVSGEIDEVGKNFVKNGGTLRSIYESGGNFKLLEGKNWIKMTDEKLLETYRFFEKYGEQIRLTDKIVQNIAIFDREVVFINLVDKDITGSERTDIVVYNKGFAEFEAMNFLSLWENSETLEDFEKQLLSTGQKGIDMGGKTKK
jgi:sugar-specific transcriptional regulator TrmB